MRSRATEISTSKPRTSVRAHSTEADLFDISVPNWLSFHPLASAQAIYTLLKCSEEI